MKDKSPFLARYGGVYEHSPWVAEQAYPHAKGVTDPARLAEIMASCVDAADEATKLALIRAHPDLTGRIRRAHRLAPGTDYMVVNAGQIHDVKGGLVVSDLTPQSEAEQRSAGLDQCSQEEFDRFYALNRRYREKFGFPFVMAVRGEHRTDILAAFERRLGNDRDEEIATAIREIHKIARLRLEAMEPPGGA